MPSFFNQNNNEYGHKELVAPWEKISKVVMRLFADEGKLFFDHHSSWGVLDTAGAGHEDGCAF